MKTWIAATAALVAALWIPASGRGTESPLDSAAVAWDGGDYVAALSTYLQVLDGPAESALETIALQTGELYRTTELTRDGAAPRFSPDGRFLTYETGSGTARVTRLLRSDDLRAPVRQFAGGGAVFSPDSGRIAVARQAAGATALVIQDVASGGETALQIGGLRTGTLAFGAGGTILFAGTPPEGGAQIYSVFEGREPVALTSGAGDRAILDINKDGNVVLFSIRAAGAGRGAPPAPGGGGAGTGQRGGGGSAAPQTFGVLSVADGRPTLITGSTPSFSADGGTLVYVTREGTENRVVAAPVTDPTNGTIVRKGTERVDAPAASPDGSRIAYQLMPNADWEIYVANRDGSAETRVTREIQHDVLPKFLSPERLLAAIGEPRHRRSFMYDLGTMKKTRLFHNNTVRTIAPEYSWIPSPDGSKILITAERDGDTVSPERGVYLVDLSTRVTRAQVRARVEACLRDEQALRAKGKRMYTPIAAAVKEVVSRASVERVFGYEKTLFDFDSKHVSQPGNKKASAYLFDQYKAFGYEPEYQWFDARGALGGQSANVVATLRGTSNPELIYVISSHYDSVAIGPGADDDSSGTAALLETARILAGHPQPATIVFASFTGEEAGLLGSREFVRRAVADKLRVVGALNNDMFGWSNDYRLDNTIRYSNAGIRDVQHAAAMQFTRLITYDALYYKSTDAAAYYEAYGDIVGGIGSYPVLGNPHYHQSHDYLETINHQLVMEVAKTTAASLMLLASSPSRITGLKIDGLKNGAATVSWAASPEKGITGYIVALGSDTEPGAQQVRVSKPTATLTGVRGGTVIAVKAVNAKGLEGWDWARVTVGTAPGNR